MANVRAHVRIDGYVQGVFFRSTARTVASAHGVKGWIHNRPDGSVEAVLEGDEADIASMIDWCRQGPAGALVESVEVDWEPPTGEFATFAVR
ncbi:MAG: acylphosphatase [Dehalococcoidales bacterium]|nr:acylphosphatase [Dehalococcoidales bacterium]